MLSLGVSSAPMGWLLWLLLLGATGEATKWKDPPPCKEGRECLDYTVVCRAEGFQARSYPASSWVGTRVEGSDYMASLVTGFWRLFRYIHLGRNDRNATIPMTGPVLTRVTGDPESFEVFFMLPKDFRGDPPRPTEKGVFLESFPALSAYVAFFGGWMTDENRRTQLERLDGRLQAEGRGFRADVHYTAGFNSPFELFNRRNEVWRLAEGELGCGQPPQEEK